ncbi:MAG: YkgJ family cysteine cluster protein [Rubrivivax sp.]|nr:YkgJ family cysteine cluster protein [Rubrivivax sp.]
MECRPACGACCTAPSITSVIPGMPQGKRAGERCVQLDDTQRCRLFGRPERPAVCASLQPQPEMCGTTRQQAMAWLGRLETHTAPARDRRSDRILAPWTRPLIDD